MQQGVSEPKCKAILLCDKTILEQGSNKISLIGVFQNFRLGTIPGLTREAEVFCQITDAEGEYELRVEIHDLDGGEIIARAEGQPIEIPHRLMRANIIIPFPQIPIPHAGKYDFVLLANNCEIDRQTFTVSEIKGGEDGSR